MRTRNVPSPWRANSQLKSAVRALPTCSSPLGAGENRTRSAITPAPASPPRAARARRWASHAAARWRRPSVGRLGVLVGGGAALDRGAHGAEVLRELLARAAQQGAAAGVGDGTAHHVVVVGAAHDARSPAPDVLGCRAGVAE